MKESNRYREKTSPLCALTGDTCKTFGTAADADCRFCSVPIVTKLQRIIEILEASR